MFCDLLESFVGDAIELLEVVVPCLFMVNGVSLECLAGVSKKDLWTEGELDVFHSGVGEYQVGLLDFFLVQQIEALISCFREVLALENIFRIGWLPRHRVFDQSVPVDPVKKGMLLYLLHALLCAKSFLRISDKEFLQEVQGHWMELVGAAS